MGAQEVNGMLVSIALPTPIVIPAEAGIHTRSASMEPHPQRLWIPACAGMTEYVW